jgi:predicted Zn-dependent protease
MKRSFQFRGLALLLALLVTEPAWTAAPTGAPQLPDPGSVGMSKQQQEQLGRQAMAEVYQQIPVLPDSSPQTQYIRQLGKRLAGVIPQEYSWPFEFHVIPQKDINAFALPGGPMFVNVGAIVAAENEAELAGVMAHEMSHVYMQHSAKQASKAQWTSLLGALGGLFGGGAAGNLARLGIQLGAGTLMMKYSRGDEAQADAVGAIILYPRPWQTSLRSLNGRGEAVVRSS